MPRRPQKTFVGPISFKPGPSRTMSAYFYLLQGASGMIQLDYPNKMEAKAARAQILKSGEAVPVPSIALLKAIDEALDDLKKTLSSGTESGDQS